MVHTGQENSYRYFEIAGVFLLPLDLIQTNVPVVHIYLKFYRCGCNAPSAGLVYRLPVQWVADGKDTALRFAVTRFSGDG